MNLQQLFEALGGDTQARRTVKALRLSTLFRDVTDWTPEVIRAKRYELGEEVLIGLGAKGMARIDAFIGEQSARPKGQELSRTHRFTVEVYDSLEFCLNPPALLTRQEAREWLERIFYDATDHRNQSINVVDDDMTEGQ